MNAIETLKKSREMLDEHYIKGELYEERAWEGPDGNIEESWYVCGMGALSMTTVGYSAYFDEEMDDADFAAAMDALVETWRAMPKSHWIKQKLSDVPGVERMVARDLEDLTPQERRVRMNELVIVINDQLGKEAILGLFDAAICYKGETSA